MSLPDFTSQPLSRELLSDKAYDVVRRCIIDGTLLPGTQLVESQLAKQLKISQAPMREALKRLNHEGLVTHVPRRGSFVTQISEDEARQAREVRVVLEELAARLTTGQLTDTYARLLRDIVAKMLDAAHQGDVGAFREQDATFHRTVIEASGNVYLPRAWQQIEPSLNSLQVVSNPRFIGDWAAMAQAHNALITLLESDDKDAAAQRFREHALGHALTS